MQSHNEKKSAGDDAALGCSSPFLHCLQQLDNDAWAETLLPKLFEAKAAGAVALTCSQLRTAVHSNVRALDLSSCSKGQCTYHISHISQEDVERSTAELPAHFPNCQVVKLLVGDTNYYVSQALLTAVSRFPRLTNVKLESDADFGRALSNPEGLGLLLGLMRIQLPNMRSLALVSAQHWWQAAGPQWYQLGGASQLTSLGLDFTSAAQREDEVAFVLNDLAQLGRLTGLQHLAVEAFNVDRQTPNAGLQFISKLTALTSLTLRLYLYEVDNVDSFGHCTGLCSLSLLRPPEDFDMLEEGPCTAVSHLTRLTQLLISFIVPYRAQPVLHKSLQSLALLQEVAAHEWVPEVLPVFAGLPHLHTVHGLWSSHSLSGNLSSNSSSSRCLTVKQLLGVGNVVPFAAFPNLATSSLADSIIPSCLTSLHTQCSKLQALGAEYDGHSHKWCSLSWPSLDDEDFSLEAERVRVAAIASLVQLPALHTLAFNATDQAEWDALARGASRLTALTSLAVVHQRGDSLQAGSILQLAKLPQLQQLRLGLPGCRVVGLDPLALLSSCAHVKHLHVVAEARVVQVLQAAVDRSLFDGHPAPAEVIIEAYTPDVNWSDTSTDSSSEGTGTSASSDDADGHTGDSGSDPETAPSVDGMSEPSESISDSESALESDSK